MEVSPKMVWVTVAASSLVGVFAFIIFLGSASF